MLLLLLLLSAPVAAADLLNYHAAQISHLCCDAVRVLLLSSNLPAQTG